MSVHPKHGVRRDRTRGQPSTDVKLNTRLAPRDGAAAPRASLGRDIATGRIAQRVSAASYTQKGFGETKREREAARQAPG